MNKIIAISVWGNNPRYLMGAKRQYELAQQYLPDWEFRVYTTEPFNIDIPLKCINVVPPDTFGAFWRFFSLFESDNNIVLSRDSDSRFTEREVRAIHEWEQSDHKFHIIRDHDSHFQFPIMAGLFGYKGKFDNSTFEIMMNYAKETNYYTTDQVFLREHIFPKIKETCLIHSMQEGWFGESRSKMKNRFDFCGNGYDENDMPLYPPTLQECVGFDPKNVTKEFKFNRGKFE
jgi:hypothetical protein